MNAKVECYSLMVAAASVQWGEWMFGMTCGCTVIGITDVLFCSLAICGC
jgi:hypothetical protein